MSYITLGIFAIAMGCACECILLPNTTPLGMVGSSISVIAIVCGITMIALGIMEKQDKIEEEKNMKFGNITNASKETINYLISIGALYEDETGIHANKDGVYPKKNSTPDR